MSKGSNRRPCVVSREEFEKNWDAAFGKPLVIKKQARKVKNKYPNKSDKITPYTTIQKNRIKLYRIVADNS